MNKVLLIGNVGQDPELRRTSTGMAVMTLSIATTDYRNSPAGEKQEHTEWHRVVVWNKQAELCAQYLTKGRAVFVEGRIQTRSWEDAGGEKRYRTEIVAHSVQFLGGREGGESVTGYIPQAQPEAEATAPVSVDAGKASVKASGTGRAAATGGGKVRSRGGARSIGQATALAQFEPEDGDLPF